MKSENIPKKAWWSGKINTKIYGLERMYLDRCIIMPNYKCFHYCQHCVRKNYINQLKRSMTEQEIKSAIDYIKNDTRINEVLITGGDPFVNTNILLSIIKKLRQIKHVGPIRIGTRVLTYKPNILTDKLIGELTKYHDYCKQKPIEISPQFNHPNELNKQTTTACQKLIKAGFRLYSQTVLLKGINNQPQILIKLFRKLRLLGIEIHYLYHCAPVQGAEHFRTTVEKGIKLKRFFRAGYLSGRCNPRFIILTSVGKVEPLIDAKIIKKENNVLFIKTPYQENLFKQLDPDFKLPSDCKVDSKGYIITKYLNGTN